MVCALLPVVPVGLSLEIEPPLIRQAAGAERNTWIAYIKYGIDGNVNELLYSATFESSFLHNMHDDSFCNRGVILCEHRAHNPAILGFMSKRISSKFQHHRQRGLQ